MAEKIKVLIITQEIAPYTEGTWISEATKNLPQHLHEKGFEIRVLMPRFGCINERRHRLHEVVRLSGMNIIVGEYDYPLLIKVASMPSSRLQVYFLDNDEFFRRKEMYEDSEGVPFADNIDRMVFFCKGALEIVKKFGWAPDIIHCHGWMTGLVPVYVKTAYRHDAIFKNSKIVYTAYQESLEKSFDSSFFKKASINDIEEQELTSFQSDEVVDLNKGIIHFSDALVLGYSSYTEEFTKMMEDSGKKILPYSETDFLQEHVSFYKNVLDK